MAATLKVDTIQNASSATANITLDTAGNATVGNTLAMGSSFLRNRIINGAMVIDQRYAGTATANSINSYVVDRWAAYQSTAGKIIAQQNAGSVTPPVGFSNYFGATSQSAYTVSSTDYYIFQQAVEGFNWSDLNWGTANAKPATLSFWVYSSLTGTFGGSIRNAAFTYSYPFSYTISSANTWQYITLVIPGPTAGTWVGAVNTQVFSLNFGMGVGSTLSGTAGSWGAANYLSATGATSVVGTNGATFYITGVQLEVGSVATPFERRQYTTEQALCFRYYWKQVGEGTTAFAPFGNGYSFSATSCTCCVNLPVPMRTRFSSLTVSNMRVYTANGIARAITSISGNQSTQYMVMTDYVCSAGGFTSGLAAMVQGDNNTAAYISVDAEL